MLACRDYEALEIALACHMAYGDKNIPLFVLQNCRGDYDAERTYDVAKRYAYLFPETIKVIDSINPGPPYRSINIALASEQLANYDLICKVDDDAFPITAGWLQKLIQCYTEQKAVLGDQLAYVTPLINNNCWGFVQTMIAMGMAEQYFAEISRPHCVGSEYSNNPVRVLDAEQINIGTCGTIWRYPYIARWIHQGTTLQPDNFIQATSTLAPIEVPAKERYSIGCILFERSLWSKVNNGGNDDEHMFHMYCSHNNKKIICDRAVPFVHLAYFTHKEENRDLIPQIRNLYQARTAHPFPISLYPSKELDLEARLRWIEKKLISQ